MDFLLLHSKGRWGLVLFTILLYQHTSERCFVSGGLAQTRFFTETEKNRLLKCPPRTYINRNDVWSGQTSEWHYLNCMKNGNRGSWAPFFPFFPAEIWGWFQALLESKIFPTGAAFVFGSGQELAISLKQREKQIRQRSNAPGTRGLVGKPSSETGSWFLCYVGERRRQSANRESRSRHLPRPHAETTQGFLRSLVGPSLQAAMVPRAWGEGRDISIAIGMVSPTGQSEC